MATTELTIDTSDVHEATAFLDRNADYLGDHEQTRRCVANLIDRERAFIIMTGKNGLVAEMSLPLMEIIARMRRGGCR